MQISLMRREFKLKKKINLFYLLLIIGLIVFFLSMLLFIVNAVTSQDLTIAWLLCSFIILGSGLILVSLILYLIKNKERIKQYLKQFK